MDMSLSKLQELVMDREDPLEKEIRSHTSTQTLEFEEYSGS